MLLAIGVGVFFLTQAALAADDSTVSGKLDEVLKNQQEILRKLDEVRQEVEIVKVRATR